MSVADALQLMVDFGSYTIAIITLVIVLIDHHDHK